MHKVYSIQIKPMYIVGLSLPFTLGIYLLILIEFSMEIPLTFPNKDIKYFTQIIFYTLVYSNVSKVSYIY